MIHHSVKIHPSAVIDCADITIGPGGVVGANCVIQGTRVVIGRDLWMDVGAVIGGGSCHDPCAYLEAGHFLHMGRNSQINIARGVTIGNECGVGIQTQIFTHGAYLDELKGFPVQFESVKIGNSVWLPNAWVNPGVSIGDNVVVTPCSLINENIPSGCLAGGTPAKVIKKDRYPKQLDEEKKLQIIEAICKEAIEIYDLNITKGAKLKVSLNYGETVFDTEKRTIIGTVTKQSEVLRNQFRRHGIRFQFSPSPTNFYEAWE